MMVSIEIVSQIFPQLADVSQMSNNFFDFICKCPLVNGPRTNCFGYGSVTASSMPDEQKRNSRIENQLKINPVMKKFKKNYHSVDCCFKQPNS